ncbi:MAG: adenylate/guanylate cyclase domain-containing protein [Candidatus Tectimicrobiota bacterium]
MSFKCKNKPLLKVVLLLEALVLPGIVGVWLLHGSVWTAYDFAALDWFYRRAVRYGYGPPRAPEIAYVTMTDKSYATFGKNFMDRADMARINDALAELRVTSVGYDIIFPHPSSPAADQAFTASLTNLGKVYLPIGLQKDPAFKDFQWGTGRAYERLRTQQLQPLQEYGRPRPFEASHALLQLDAFAEAAVSSGHITAFPDSDGVYRHLHLLLKIDTGYLPTLALSMFLDAVQVPLRAVTIAWGKAVTIPAIAGSQLTHDLRIPIDEQGRVFIPHAQSWRDTTAVMPGHALLQYMDDPDLRGNLMEFFEDKFVFVADVSSGIADLGQTSLDSGAPLVVLHSGLMNGLLTGTFYRQWAFGETLGLIAVLGLLVALAAVPQSSMVLYITGGMIGLLLLGFTGLQCRHFVLFPIVTVGSSFACVFLSMVSGLQIAIARDQAFIRDTFAKYVSEKVVHELLQHPELIKPGGEERVLSVLFTDIADFTSLSEKITPTALVRLLNEYLTEMTTIVIEEGGIIDKYIGDAIMAEFGAPLPIEHHADLAVRTGLRMQSRLRELRAQWIDQGFPSLHCRVGINTGPMVVGNIGSAQVFNYTVIGDAVNLASRLEGANKHYNTLVMISEFTHAFLTPHTFRTRLLDVIRVQGKSQAVKVYEVYGEMTETLPAQDLEYYETYNEAFERYLLRHFDEARERFATALVLRPHDTSAREMLERIASLQPDTLPEDWDGAVSLSK